MNAPDTLWPDGLWSLWDMVNLQLGQMIEIFRRLEVNLLTLKSLNDDGDGSERISEINGAAIQGNVRLLKVLLKETGDKHIDHSIDQLWSAIGHCKNNAQIYAKMEVLYQSLRVSFSDRLAYCYPKDKGDIFRRWKDDWDIVYTNFASARLDIVEGIDCYALGHNMACVFHMARVGEIGLRAIGRERGIQSLKGGVPIEWATWGQVLQEIEPKTEDIRKNEPKGPKKEHALQFYNTVLSNLRAIRNLYRDPTMHFRDNYDDGEAQSAIFRVRSLMTMLSSKLDENSIGPIPSEAWC